jgi:small subunit ribosomal protein S17e
VGQVKTLYVKHLAKTLVEKYPGRFTDKFDKNKKELDKLVKMESKKIRNEVAGYIVDVIKMQSKPKGMEITYRPTEDRRRGRWRRRK